MGKEGLPGRGAPCMHVLWWEGLEVAMGSNQIGSLLKSSGLGFEDWVAEKQWWWVY